MRLSRKECPRCKSPLVRSKSYAGNECKTWLECTKCNTYIHTYMPLQHQQALHRDNHPIVGNFGGYGTGKTTTSREEMIKHILITPNATIVAGANVSSQYKQTLKLEFEKDFPAAFVADYSAQEQTMDFINGAKLLWRSYDDEGKLRSLNLSMMVILEASEVKDGIYTQGTARLRSVEAGIPLLDEHGEIVYEVLENGDEAPVMAHTWRRMVVESNPDAGWIRSEILMRSEKIHQHGVGYVYDQDPERILKNQSSHVASSEVNPYLPKGFVADLRARYPKWWAARYLDGSFQYAEGMVYPNAGQAFCEPFDIPKEWLRLVAFDYGLADLAAFIFVAIDPYKGIAYVYKEATGVNMDIPQLAKMYHLHSADIPAGGLYCSPIIDPKSGPKRGYDKKTLSDQFLDYNINFKPGEINVEARIFRMNTYINTGRLKIFDTCVVLKKELLDYKYKERSATEFSRDLAVPKDANNHCINAVEWICMELPADPRSILRGVYDRGNILPKENPKEFKNIPWQFQDEPEEGQGGRRTWW